MPHVSLSDLRIPKRLPGSFVSLQPELRLDSSHFGRDVARFFQSPETNEACNQDSMIGRVQAVFVVGHPAPLHRLLEITFCVQCEVEKHIEAEKTLIER